MILKLNQSFFYCFSYDHKVINSSDQANTPSVKANQLKATLLFPQGLTSGSEVNLVSR